jgi:hypothetical protein
MADGTAPQCGRVGSCHIHLNPGFYPGFFFAFRSIKISPLQNGPFSANKFLHFLVVKVSLHLFSGGFANY